MQLSHDKQFPRSAKPKKKEMHFIMHKIIILNKKTVRMHSHKPAKPCNHLLPWVGVSTLLAANELFSYLAWLPPSYAMKQMLNGCFQFWEKHQHHQMSPRATLLQSLPMMQMLLP
jgi:hypothetical protein